MRPNTSRTAVDHERSVGRGACHLLRVVLYILICASSADHRIIKKAWLRV